MTCHSLIPSLCFVCGLFLALFPHTLEQQWNLEVWSTVPLTFLFYPPTSPSLFQNQSIPNKKKIRVHKIKSRI